MSQEQVKAFHEKNRLPIAVSLSVESESNDKMLFDYMITLKKMAIEILPYAEAAYYTDQRLHRLHLFLEELSEIAEAFLFMEKIELADALGDLDYITKGTAVVFDIPLERVFQEIHRSNMTKDCRKMATERKTKGPNYEPPNLEFVK